jgi:hypothetical protein
MENEIRDISELEESAYTTIEEMVERCQPHLQKLSFIFGKHFNLSLVVQAEGQPGCLVMTAGKVVSIPELIQCLRETERLERESNVHDN